MVQFHTRPLRLEVCFIVKVDVISIVLRVCYAIGGGHGKNSYEKCYVEEESIAQ